MYSSGILPKTNKGQVTCWPIHKTPAGFSRTFSIFNKVRPTRFGTEMCLYMPCWKAHTDTVKWRWSPSSPLSTRKSGFYAATWNRSQGNKNWILLNLWARQPQTPTCSISKVSNTTDGASRALVSLLALLPYPSAQLPRRGLPAFPWLCHFSSLLLKST